MVLHNDKWAKKAKRAVERRKGISGNVRGASYQPDQTLARLDMGRDDEQSSASESEESQKSGCSFEFDSGDEGKTEEERKRLAEHRTQDTSRDPKDTRPIITQTSEAPKSVSDTITTTRPDKRFARRRLVDNSSRYEEPTLDPYIQVAEPEEEPDYRSISTRHFTNPNEVELVPDERNLPKKPLPMTDTSHFDKLRLIQQKEEYARDLKHRFGSRRETQQAPTGVGQEDDDAFFAEIGSFPQPQRNSGNVSAVPTSTDLQHHKVAEQDQRKLEQYLDDLLKL